MEVSSTAGPEELKAPAGNKLSLAPGMVVQELGWDSDVDDDVRVMIEDSIDGELIEEAVEAVDVVLLWWREGDGDLVEAATFHDQYTRSAGARRGGGGEPPLW